MMDLDVKIVELGVFLMKVLKNVQNVKLEKEEMRKEMNVLNVKLDIILQKLEVEDRLQAALKALNEKLV